MSNKTGSNDRQSVTYIILGGSLLIIIFLTIFILVSGASDSKMDYVHIIIPVIATWVVNRQGKWDTIGTEDNGHLGACSCSLEEVK